MRGMVMSGVRAFGVGAGMAAGWSALSGATSGGVADVVGESLGGSGARIEDFVLGDLPQEARAGSRARDEAARIFGMQSSMTGKIAPGAKQWYEQMKSINMHEEMGKKMFNMSDDFRSVNPEDLLKRVIDAITKALHDCFNLVLAKLDPFS